MSEVIAEPTTPPVADAPAPTPPAQETDWKAEASKWEARAKDNKTALDDLTGKYAAAETQLGELSTKVQTFEAEKDRSALLNEVSTATGVPASALRGNTREELEAHAADLAELIKPSGPVIPGQEKTPQSIPDSPDRQFVGKLFGSD